MNPFTFIKRLFQTAGCLVVVVVMAGSAVTAYIDKNPEAQERVKLSVMDAEMRVDEESTFFERLGALIASWWDSDELVADAKQDKELREESKKQRAERERERRFNESHYSDSDDYYGSSQ